MSIYSKLAVIIILFTFLVGCQAKSPGGGGTSSSDDGSSSDDSSSTSTYSGKWINSNNTIGLDWKSDSFIYLCTSIQYYFSRSWILIVVQIKD